MPTIRRFADCKISIYADDHFPPHFHIEGRGFRAVVEIETMIIRAGEIRRAADAMAWLARISSCCGPNGCGSIGGSNVTDAPNIKAVQADEGRSVVVLWRGGAESIVDISAHLKEYAVFAPLRRDDERFRAVEVGEWGWCVHWSDDMEIASDTLWRLALEQGAEWLRGWRTNKRMSQSEAARALGVSPRMWRYYEAGTHLLPKTVRLAAIGLDVADKGSVTAAH